MNIQNYKGIWVFAEQTDGELHPVALELLAKAKELQKKSGERVAAVLLGHNVEPLAQRLLDGGAEEVLLVEHPNLAVYKTLPYTHALCTLVERHKPAILLLGATALGRDLAPRVMARLGVGLTADCLDLDLDEKGTLIQTKPSYGGNILCTIVVPGHRPQMTTVRPRVFSPLEPQSNPQGKVIAERIDIPDDPDFEVLTTMCPKEAGMSLGDAEAIVAIGRGVRQEDIPMMEELASLLKAKMGCSRPLVDVGWFDHDDQIGQSGTTVKPKLILSVGISGAVQYTVGMQKAKCIVTINKNPDANLFCSSHYGAVGDYAKLVPALIEALKER